MNPRAFYYLTLLFSSVLCAEEQNITKEQALEQHAKGAEKVAEEQDELSATVQQLVMEQTMPEVIELLSEVEDIMDETTDYLSEPDTGGRTIAAQTEIIEKIHQAAKKKQQQGGGGQAGSAMMDMMERMMGKGEGQGKANEKGEGQSGDKAGQGGSGNSNSDNELSGGPNSGKTEERRVPKAAGQAGKNLPNEFQSALDAYNRGLEEMGK